MHAPRTLGILFSFLDELGGHDAIAATQRRSTTHSPTMAMRQQVGSLLARRLAALREPLVPAAALPRCQRCFRPFSTTPVPLAGHNKWSKTKHIKAVTDKKKMTERTTFTKTIAMYSKRLCCLVP
jgi:hypothetical protein